MKSFLLAACLLATACSTTGLSPYAGQESRSVKALADAEVEGLTAGEGMGYAKAAELNGYPGPAHVLQLADRLNLTPAQRESIGNVMRAHKAEARTLGAELVALERELDGVFARREATPERVDGLLRTIAAKQAALRGSHLKAHIATTALLEAAQVAAYGSLRGYGDHHRH